MRDEINGIKQSKQCLIVKVKCIMLGIGFCQSTACSLSIDNTEVTKTFKPVKTTYAVLSKNERSEVGKLTHNENINMTHSLWSCVACRRMAANWDVVTDILFLISCHAKPHKLDRLGRSDRHGAIEIEFNSPSDSRDVQIFAIYYETMTARIIYVLATIDIQNRRPSQ